MFSALTNAFPFSRLSSTPTSAASRRDINRNDTSATSTSAADSASKFHCFSASATVLFSPTIRPFIYLFFFNQCRCWQESLQGSDTRGRAALLPRSVGQDQSTVDDDDDDDIEATAPEKMKGKRDDIFEKVGREENVQIKLGQWRYWRDRNLKRRNGCGLRRNIRTWHLIL